MRQRLKKLFIISLIAIFTSFFICQFWGLHVLQAQTTADDQASLQKQLDDIEKEISQLQTDLKSLASQKNTLQNKIKQLEKQKAALALKIKANNLQLDNVNLQVQGTQQKMKANSDKMDTIKSQMSEYLKSIYLADNYSLLYIVLRDGTLSSIFQEIESNQQILNQLDSLLSQAKDLGNQLKQEADDLANQQDSLENLRRIQNLQSQNLTDLTGAQKDLLKQTKGKESLYQSNLSDAKKQAQEIRNRLYALLEVQKQINFGQAVQIATWAAGQTGVRPAFLLGILTQESNLGRNVGTCNRAGDPPTKSYKVVMHPTRDQPKFLDITSALGRNPDITPISCPMHDKQGNQIGWGGAMGPAQFIPSTWVGYSNKVASITGKSADPWDIRDAFLAASLKVAADGATSQANEWAAAMRYFSGSTNPAYSFYGDNVVALTQKYQSDIAQMNQ